jgi:hypothetical protein
MIIENTPLSLPTLIPLLIPYLRPFLLIPNLLTEKWDAHIAVPKFGKNIAVLGLVGGRDELVVDGQMKGIRKLIEGREAADAKRIRWKEFPNGTHSKWFYWSLRVTDRPADERLSIRRYVRSTGILSDHRRLYSRGSHR